MSKFTKLLTFLYPVVIIAILSMFAIQVMASLNSSNNSQIQLRPTISKTLDLSSSSKASSSLATKPPLQLVDSSIPRQLSLKGWVGSVDLEMTLTLLNNKLEGEYTNPIDKTKYKLVGEYVDKTIKIEEKSGGFVTGTFTFGSESDEAGLVDLTSDSYNSFDYKKLHGKYETKTSSFDVFLTQDKASLELASLEKSTNYKLIAFKGKTFFLQDSATNEYFFSNEDWKLQQYKIGTNLKITSKSRLYSQSKSYIDTQLAGNPSRYQTSNGLFQIKTLDVIKDSIVSSSSRAR
jgi:hypothetical protein